jgi:hypothetical protein
VGASPTRPTAPAGSNRQGRSGLGLDAQREAIQRFADAEKLKLAGEHAEVETGTGSFFHMIVEA